MNKVKSNFNVYPEYFSEEQLYIREKPSVKAKGENIMIAMIWVGMICIAVLMVYKFACTIW